LLERSTGLRTALLIFSLTLSGGTVGYHLLEGWPFLECLYMTAITITTVGFGEVRPLDGAGRLFTLLLILVGTVSIGYVVSSVTATLVSGEVRRMLRGQRMERRMSRMKDHVILCGWGKIGREIARECSRAGLNLCVVEQDERLVEQALEEGLVALCGDATDAQVLERVGIRQARGLLTALPKDSDNLFVVLTARELNPGVQIVARGLEPSSEARLRRAGADHVVSPYVIGGRRMAAVLLQPEIVDFLDIFMNQDELGFSLSRLEIHPDSPLCGHTLAEARLREVSGGALVLGLVREGGIQPLPGVEQRFVAGETLILLGSREMQERLHAAGF
jgi:voltage-gated potassium channel